MCQHTMVDKFSILGREMHITKIIKEAMDIRVNDPSPNRNISKFQLSYIWDVVLSNTLDHHLKYSLLQLRLATVLGTYPPGG